MGFGYIVARETKTLQDRRYDIADAKNQCIGTKPMCFFSLTREQMSSFFFFFQRTNMLEPEN
jgi:hypothetical protein